MDITKKNFKELLPMVKDAIEESHFMAIDTELTGLYTQDTEHAFDTMSERYAKYRENCSKFLIIQFGLSTFQYHPAQKKYTHKDFNFYVFPRSHIRQSPDSSFMCQTSSLHFLATQGFDFNKVIYEGIPYLTSSQEEKLKDFLKTKHENEKQSIAFEGNDTPRTNGQKDVIVPDEHKDFIEKINKQVDSFISNDSETVIQLEPCNSFRRKLIYQTVQKNHRTGIEMSTSTNQQHETFITVSKASDTERLDKLESKQISDMDDLDSAVGIRKVLDLISESKKLVIGHNMMLDVLHMIDKFFCAIPETLDDFKELVKCTFPRLIDTKHIASSEKLRDFFSSTCLSGLGKTLQGKAFKMPTIEAADGFKGYDLNEEKLHEAGFDAFLTGLCFIGLATKLGTMASPAVDYVSPASKLLSPYINRVFIMKHFDIPFLNLKGPDPEPRRENVFYITFPKEWRTIDLVELFSPYGNIYVSWLNEHSALVALKNPSQVVNAQTVLFRNVSSLYCVKTYAEFQRLNQKREHPAEHKALEESPADSLQPGKRRASRVTDAASNRRIDPIPEVAENEAERAEDSVSTSYEGNNILVRKSQASSSGGSRPKKQRISHDDNETNEVSSTAKVFDEENVW